MRWVIAAGAVGPVLRSVPEHLLIDALRLARTGELAVSSRRAHGLLIGDLVGNLAPREIQVFELLARASAARTSAG